MQQFVVTMVPSVTKKYCGMPPNLYLKPDFYNSLVYIYHIAQPNLESLVLFRKYSLG